MSMDKPEMHRQLANLIELVETGDYEVEASDLVEREETNNPIAAALGQSETVEAFMLIVRPLDGEDFDDDGFESEAERVEISSSTRNDA